MASKAGKRSGGRGSDGGPERSNMQVNAALAANRGATNATPTTPHGASVKAAIRGAGNVFSQGNSASNGFGAVKTRSLPPRD
jgi:hypothetical protein